MNHKACCTIFVAICLMGLVNCTTGDRTALAGSAPEAITATSGTPQSHAISGAFAAPLVAAVIKNGSPVSGVAVTFTAPTTGASGIFADTGNNTSTATTDANGVATSPVFSANGTVGAYTVTASAPGVQTGATFSLANTTAAPAAVIATSGTPQSTNPSSVFPSFLVVTVVDAGQNPVQNAVVTFQAPATGASGIFAFTGNTTATASTNASGVASSLAFFANASSGTYIVTATVAGVTTPANFNLTNLGGAAGTITATSGTPQSTLISTAFPAPLVATVSDSHSNPVSGVAVTFSAPASPASGTFANGTITETDTTDANGLATSSVFTANATQGSYAVTATAAGVTTPASFSLTNTLTAVTSKTYVFYLSGEEQPSTYVYALAGAVQIDGNGNVLGGKQDYNNGGGGVTSPQPTGDTISGGTLVADPTTGQGTLTLNTNNSLLGVAGTETFGIQFVNVDHALIIQFQGSTTSSGSMDVQTLPASLSGGYAFTLSGTDPTPAPVAFGGVFSISGGTTLQNGFLDTNDNGTVATNVPLSGTLTAPDSFGRGTISSSAINYNSVPVALNYYVVGPEALRIIDVDFGDSAVGSAFGQGTNATSATNASLGNSVFGIIGNSQSQYAAAGMFSTIPSSATFSGVADDNEMSNGAQAIKSSISGSYTVGSNGYGSLTIGSSSLGNIGLLGVYMTDPQLNLSDPNNTTSGKGGALLADMDGNGVLLAGGTGIVIPQTDTSTASFTGNYDFGGQDYNFFNPPGEFDFVGAGSVTNLALSGTALVSDPFLALGAQQTNSGVQFSGAAVPDTTYPGRYTMSPLQLTVGTNPALNLAIYQANGGQLVWLNGDQTTVFLGSLEQQGSLAGIPGSNVLTETIAATSGTPQSAVVSTAFGAQLVATVTTGGSPTSGVLVTFTAPATGASGTFAGTNTNTATAMTNTLGVATSPVFTANATAGTYTVTAAAPGVVTSASFNLTNTAAAVETITATSGTPQSAVVSTAFGAQLVATVMTGSSPMNGVTVTFTAPSAGASGIFAGTNTNTATAMTNAFGVATSPVFTANATAGTYAVTAAAPGVVTSASFSLTNTAAVVETITATSGTPQSATVSTAFGAPLVATVMNGSSPVSGVLVTFAAPTTGASGTFAGGNNTATTNASGVATSSVFTANATAGAYAVTATAPGVVTSASFSLTNTSIVSATKTYVFYLTGEDLSSYVYALAGSVQIDGNGNVLGGEQDYNNGGGNITSPQPTGDTITGGTLVANSIPGQYTLTLNTDNLNLGVSGTETFGVQFVNVNHALIIQFNGVATSSGSMDVQTLPASLTGGYAFTLSGTDPSLLPVAFGGVFSISGTTVKNGLLDTNDDGAVTPSAALSGTLTTFDTTYGRGTISSSALNYGGSSIALNYYVVGPEALRIIDVDTTDTAIGSAFGQGANATSATNASLGKSVFGIVGVSGNSLSQYAAAGMFSTTPSSGAFSGVADDDEIYGAGQIIDTSVSGTYAIGSNGYGSMSIPSALGSMTAFGIYMTDPNLNLSDPNNITSGLGGALLVDMDGNAAISGGTGIALPQTDTSTAKFTGKYAFGAQDYNYLSTSGEFDFVGAGSVTSLSLSGTGLVSDPFTTLGAQVTNSGVTFTGTFVPDTTNPGRYTMSPLQLTIGSVTPPPFNLAVYQANGEQLFWLNEDSNTVFLGSLEQQGSLTGLPAARKGPSKTSAKRRKQQ